MATYAQFNFTAYLEQPVPWQNEPATIRAIVISVTVRPLAPVFPYYLLITVSPVDCLVLCVLAPLHSPGRVKDTRLG